MKKILLLALCLAVSAPLAAVEPRLRFGAGYSFLINPGFASVEDQPDAHITRGGWSVSGQALLGHIFRRINWMYGAEAGYMRAYSYTYGGAQPNETTLDSYPFLLIGQYSFVDMQHQATFPFLVGGLGVSYDVLATKVAGVADTSTSNDFALMLGPGISLKRGTALSVDALLRYYVIFTKTEYTRSINLSVNIAFWRP